LPVSDESLSPFLPQWPPDFGQLGWFALLLVAAVALGEVTRLLKLPRLVGYVAAGMALGPNGSGLMHPFTVSELRVLVDVALGLLLFELGHWLDLSWLKRNPWLIVTSLLESALTFAAVFVALRLVGVSIMYASGAAAIGMATSPAVIVQVTRECRAQGQVTERVKMLTALNCAYAVIAITIWTSWLHLEYLASPGRAVMHPLYLIFGSVVLAVAATAIAAVVPKRLRSHPATMLLLLLGLVLLLIGGARSLGLSPLLGLLSFGLLAKHGVAWLRVLPTQFATITSVTSVLLFALIGASSNLASLGDTLEPLGSVALVVAAFVLARLVAKWIATTITALPSGISLHKGSLLGLGLAPMSGLAVVLVQNVSGLYPTFPVDLTVIVVAAVSLLEIIGPILTKISLLQAKEALPE
jgi:Kef-type K+ transport system membrane component KefB